MSDPVPTPRVCATWTPADVPGFPKFTGGDLYLALHTPDLAKVDQIAREWVYEGFDRDLIDALKTTDSVKEYKLADHRRQSAEHALVKADEAVRAKVDAVRMDSDGEEVALVVGELDVKADALRRGVPEVVAYAEQCREKTATDARVVWNTVRASRADLVEHRFQLAMSQIPAEVATTIAACLTARIYLGGVSPTEDSLLGYADKAIEK